MSFFNCARQQDAYNQALAQYQRSAQQQMQYVVQGYGNHPSTTLTGSIGVGVGSGSVCIGTSASYYAYGGDTAQGGTVAYSFKAKPESNLAWLDRRVEEMRVRL